MPSISSFFRSKRTSAVGLSSSNDVPSLAVPGASMASSRQGSIRSPSPNPSNYSREPLAPQPPVRPESQDVEMTDASLPSPPPLPVHAHSRGLSLEVPNLRMPSPQTPNSNFNRRSPSPSPSVLAPPDNESRALASLSTQCALSLATVAAELAPIPCIGILVGCLTVVFQAVEKSRVNREQWKLLQGRCVMVTRIAGAQVTNYGGEHYPGLVQATEFLRDKITEIGQRADYWNNMAEFLAFVQFQGISEEIRMHFSSLDQCLTLFSYATDVAQMQWIGEFSAVQRQELIALEQMRAMMESMNMNLNLIGHNQEEMKVMTSQMNDKLREVLDDKSTILQNQATTTVAAYADTQRIVNTILTVTGLRLPPKILLGKQCILDANVPIKTGVTCDIYAASFLGGEKVAKKVFRIGMSEKEHVERYAQRFLRDAQLWAEFRSDFTLPFYGIGMEAFEGDKHFQLYMVSPLMKNFDAITYLKQHKSNPGMKEGIMRIITDAARGLQYLHDKNPPVVHSGMRGDNILITDSGGAILGGFGLTKALQSSTGNDKIPPAVMTGKTESQRWMAPEMFAEDSPILQTPSDVWGWAMAALELISGLPPYHHNKQPHTVMLDIRLNRKPQRAKHADFEKYALNPDAMWALLEKCWEVEPEKRPTIDEVLVDLKKISKLAASS